MLLRSRRQENNNGRKIMRRKALLGFALMAIAATLAVAHGEKKHVTGTVEKVSGDAVVVKTMDGKSVEVKLTPNTTYVSRVGSEDKQAAVSDLAVGNRVVIHATPKGGTLEADEVRFSAARGSSAAKPKP
jgi:uncharacterized protein (DUF2147 family)